MTPGAEGYFLAVQLFGILFVLVGAWGGQTILRRVLKTSALPPRFRALSFVFGAVAGVAVLGFAYATDTGEPNWWVGIASAVPLAFVGGFVSARQPR